MSDPDEPLTRGDDEDEEDDRPNITKKGKTARKNVGLDLPEHLKKLMNVGKGKGKDTSDSEGEDEGDGDGDGEGVGAEAEDESSGESDDGGGSDEDDDEDVAHTHAGIAEEVRQYSESEGEGDDEDEDDDDDDDENEEYLQKFNENMRENYLINFHPESLTHNYDEIMSLSAVTRNNAGIVVDELHRTVPFMTKYEKTRILGQRAKQLNEGAMPMVPVEPTVIDGYLIAQRELEQKRIPFIIRRPLPNGGSEYWKIQDLEIL